MSELDVVNLASSYNLRVQILSSVVLVYSQINQWLVEFDAWDNIKLFHFNSPRRNCRTHEQIEFYNENKVASYDYVFKYIRGHDDAAMTGTKFLKTIS